MGNGFIDLTGMKFGRLTVIKRVDDHIQPNGKRCLRWLCVCENDGNEIIVRGANLPNGHTTSCGCYRKELAKKKIINLAGKMFGRLLVIKRASDHVDLNGNHKTQWLCKCQNDGNEVIVYSYSLTSGNTISCGCYSKERISESSIIDLTNKRFGKLVVLERVGSNNNQKSMWSCQCDCGNTIVTQSANLINGDTKSCGCLNESLIAFELKKYFTNNYNAISEYKILKNPNTGFWLPYDIYLPENIFIEVNGKHHYQNENHFFKNDEEFQYRKKLDRIKRKFARKNGIYIEIDLRKIKTTEQAINYIESYL